jgi:hypothetical protein
LAGSAVGERLAGVHRRCLQPAGKRIRLSPSLGVLVETEETEREWPSLYDPDQLRNNGVAAAAAVYVDDMYVDCVLSEATAGLIRGLRAWVTDEYQHNGLEARLSGGAGRPGP